MSLGCCILTVIRALRVPQSRCVTRAVVLVLLVHGMPNFQFISKSIAKSRRFSEGRASQSPSESDLPVLHRMCECMRNRRLEVGCDDNKIPSVGIVRNTKRSTTPPRGPAGSLIEPSPALESSKKGLFAATPSRRLTITFKRSVALAVLRSGIEYLHRIVRIIGGILPVKLTGISSRLIGAHSGPDNLRTVL